MPESNMRVASLLQQQNLLIPRILLSYDSNSDSPNSKRETMALGKRNIRYRKAKDSSGPVSLKKNDEV